MQAPPVPTAPEPFFLELDALEREARRDQRPEDVRQVRRLDAGTRVLASVGLATAGLGVNPVTIAALALAQGIRWMAVAHHVLHGAYDAYPGVPKRYTSAAFARGKRRFLDWFDWLIPQPWVKEHNGLHHFRLGEQQDPDLPEANAAATLRSRLPLVLRLILLGVHMATWKFTYYVPNIVRVVYSRASRRETAYRPWLRSHWDPTLATGRRVWRDSWLIYPLLRFVVLPAPFLAVSVTAFKAAVLNLLLADVACNIYTWCMIVPNHAGSDLVRFDRPATSREEGLLRQILGSTNYTTGGELNDALHGFLNYQVEHHLWPNLTPGQYQRVQPKLKALCQRYGIPYTQEPVPKRMLKTVKNVLGYTSMVRVGSVAVPEPRHVAGA